VLVSLNRSRTLYGFALGCVAWFAASALAMLSSAAQGAFPDPAPVQQESSNDANPAYPVKGVVLNSVTNQPVARALVDSHEGAVLSDNDGHFELDLPAGMVQISVKRPGYGSRGRVSNHMVRVGPNMPELSFDLVPEALITGQVTLSTSDAADGIRVMAYRRRIVNGREQWMMEGSARTSSDGVFRIAGLSAGDYLIYTQPARDSDEPSGRGAKVYGYPAAYYPGVSDISSAGVLTLGAGQHGQADFTLARQGFYPVTVMIANNEGGGMNLQVRDRSGRQMGFPVRWNAQQGNAQVNVPNGSYFLEGRRRGEAQLYGRVDFNVAGAPLAGLNMTLLPLHPIPVTVRKVFTSTSNTGAATNDGQAGGEPSASAGLNISLAPAEEFFGSPGGGGLRAVDGASASGSFEIENVGPGRYWVEASPFEGYVSSITSGGVDLARDPLVIGPGATTAPIEVTLRDDTATIAAQLSTASVDPQTGTASSGEQKDIYVYAIPLFASSTPIRMSGFQGSGQVSISGLAPGSYRVIAFDAPQEIDFHSPEGLAKYAGEGQTVTVDAGGTGNVQLDVIHTVSTESE